MSIHYILAQEEASIPASLAQKAIPVGTVSYVEELDTGVFPEIQYCYDLVVPTEFTPRVNDGEVDGFYCETIDQASKTHTAYGHWFNNLSTTGSSTSTALRV